MAYKLSDGTYLPTDTPFSIGDINYPANWLRLSTAEEKKAVGITEIADPTIYDDRFYDTDGKAKNVEDTDALDNDGKVILDTDGNKVINYGVKTLLKRQEKITAASKLSPYDWYVVRKSEKGTAIPTDVSTYRDAVRTACDTREKEIDACSDTAALVTLYGQNEKGENNMTHYPDAL